MPETGLPDLIAQAYEAACDADGLGEFIRSAADYFGAQQAALVIWPVKHPEALLPIAHDISHDEIRVHFENRIYPDTLFGKLATLPAGETFIAEGLSAGAEYESMDILAGVIASDGQNRCGIFFVRTAEQAEFSRTEHETLKTLMGYFRRAITLNTRFVNIFNQQKTALAVLNHAPRGIIAIGQNGQTIHMNVEAKRILEAEDGISLAGNSIACRDEDVHAKIQEFLDYAREVGTQEGTTKRLTASIKRPSRAAPYQMMAYALPFEKTKADLNEDEALAALIIYDPATGVDLTFESLKTFYELSSAEARLAELMGDGDGLPAAAVKLGISVNTARSQLRGIFKKVGVSSQAALLKEFAKALKLPELFD